jgi:3-deoxy-D-manno-octulosonic-acid transferase
MNPMSWRTLLYVLVEVLLLPFVLLYLLAGAKHRKSLLKRFGLGLKPMETCLWVHAVSVGEFLAGRRLIQALQEQYPETPVVVSTVTLTGAKVAQSGGARHIFFPFDLPFVVERFLNFHKPKIVVILETEVWPYFLSVCLRRKISVVICNGRLSETSFRRYRRFKGLLRPAFESIPLILAQGEPDARRFMALGARNVRVAGNIKYDAVPPSLPEATAMIYQEFTQGRNGWVAGSTMSGEERMVLDAHREILKKDPKAFLILAPRHPERREEVTALLNEFGFSFAQRSTSHEPPATSHQPRPQVFLLDTVGELAYCYRFGRLNFVGGSLVPTGGHNIIEPALCRKTILIGPHYGNFKGIVADFLDREAVVIASPDVFSAQAADLYADPGPYGERAYDVVQANQGSLNRTLEALRVFLA